MNLTEVLETLYAAEINCDLSSFWDGGWRVRLGDSVNGWVSGGNFDDLEEAAEWLWQEALACYPHLTGVEID